MTRPTPKLIERDGVRLVPGSPTYDPDDGYPNCTGCELYAGLGKGSGCSDAPCGDGSPERPWIVWVKEVK